MKSEKLVPTVKSCVILEKLGLGFNSYFAWVVEGNIYELGLMSKSCCIYHTNDPIPAPTTQELDTALWDLGYQGVRLGNVGWVLQKNDIVNGWDTVSIYSDYFPVTMVESRLVTGVNHADALAKMLIWLDDEGYLEKE